MSKNIAFLFGAGVSIPSKIPSTKDITEKIFLGEGIVRGMAENYFFGDPKKFDYDPYQEFIPRIVKFLNLLKKELQVFYQDSNEIINYEDIYYLVDFIRKNIYGAEKNPAFRYLLKSFEKTINDLSKPIDPLIDSRISFESLLDEVIRYLEYTVIQLLSISPKNFNGLNFLKDLLADSNYSRIDFFTLNHDRVLENFLRLSKELICDGFGEEENEFRFWNKELYSSNNRTNFYKLHGSVDWYYYDPESWVDRRVCKCSPNIIWRDPRKPILLIGTYNKLAKYIESIYLDLFCLFYKTIYHHHTIIVVGYSFGDKGINEKLFDWVLQENHKMIIIDPCVENLKNKMWPVLNGEWDKKEKIIPIQEYSENITWDKIKEYLY